MPSNIRKQAPVFVSLAIFARNEERTIDRCLREVAAQSLFRESSLRGLASEIVCVVNGSTDRTAELATRFFATASPSCAESFSGRVVTIPEPGKLNAWNRYVHEVSPREAGYLIMMDADIHFLSEETLSRMVEVLERDSAAQIAVDEPRKSLELGHQHSWKGRLSASASGVTRSASAQLCAQLYCIRSEAARAIYLPKDLGACEDGFIKALVCTDMLSGPLRPERIRLAEGAAHSFEAYTTVPELVRNQKRQVMGQTVVHLLVDEYLPALPLAARERLAETLQARDRSDPEWLKRELAKHIERTKGFWNVCPGYVTTPLRRWSRLSKRQKLARFPAAAIQSMLALFGSYLAYQSLRRGCTSYWPQANRVQLRVTPSPTSN